MNFYMLFGVLCGVLAALLVAALAFWVAGQHPDSQPKFDERQIAAQNVSYKRGFFAMIICCVLSGLAVSYDGFPFPLREGAVILISASIVIGLLVFAVTAIMKDAYFGYNQDMRKWYLSFGVLGGGNLLMGFDYGKTCWIHFEIAALMLIVLLAAILHRWRHPAVEEDDDE